MMISARYTKATCKFSQHLVHEPLEGVASIPQAAGEEQELEKSERGDDGGVLKMSAGSIGI
jgi:hypothetical protein